MKASIRVNSLTLSGSGNKTLYAMELHGKRLDQSSQNRRVRDVEPLVYGSLDLRAAYDEHVAGCRMNAGLKRPVLHALIQFPTELGHSEKNRRMMLKHAVEFIQRTHGGDAVFAARLDQDEAGLATVDVFYSPKYEKQTKKKTEVWISTSKHGKEIAEKHRDEIMRRGNGVFRTRPRDVGMALQSELHEYLTAVGLKLEPKREKAAGKSDRVDPETYGVRQDALKAADEAEARVAALEAEQSALDCERRILEAEQRQFVIEKTDFAQEREAFEIERRTFMKWADAQRLALRQAMARVAAFFKRPDLPMGARSEAISVADDARAALKPAGASSAEPAPEPGRDLGL